MPSTDPEMGGLHGRAERVAHLLDSAFRIPGTDLRVGIDALLGLLPVVGDATSAALSGYVVAEGYRAGVPRATLARMVLNVGIDLALGAIPFVGDLTDVVWKANERNVALVRERSRDPSGARRDRRMLVGLFVVLLTVVASVMTLLNVLVQGLLAFLPV
jgi:hypothetical protein